jgi:hypothetical protein
VERDPNRKKWKTWGSSSQPAADEQEEKPIGITVAGGRRARRTMPEPPQSGEWYRERNRQ